jgi:fumarate hydratase class II
MPGKVNPVIPEVILQVSAYVIGAFVSSSIGDQNAPLELNIMQPLIGYNSLFSVKILKNSVYVFSEKCIKSIRANKKRCEEIVEWSISIVTPLAKKIGYDKAAEIAKRALKENKRIIDIVIEEKLLPEEEAKKILNPKNML